MKKGGSCGNSTLTGTQFEQKTNLVGHLKSKGYKQTPGTNSWGKDDQEWLSIPQWEFKKHFEQLGVDFSSIWSKMLKPDEALYNPNSKELIVIEKKFQQTSGSVDEKLETFPFKKWKYEKLISTGHVSSVRFIFLGNDWFQHPRYNDAKEFMQRVGIEFCINSYPPNLPLTPGS